MKTITGVIVKRATDVLFWIFLAYLIAEAGNACAERQHGWVQTTSEAYTESNRQLWNPNRGFYTMFGFTIENKKQDFFQDVEQKMSNDRNALSLIQINLRNFKYGPITEQGLENIEVLFEALASREKQYIIRFLYDWSGKATETEPEDIQIILTHMSQVEEVLSEYSHIIFTFQGIFIGDCGEMHDSVHMTDEGMAALMERFLQISPEDTYLSVRTPQQWRILTGILETEDFCSTELSKRLGLYNDGIMGTEFDTGTYGLASKEDAGLIGKWSREDELDFQSELCKLVPNGGEVILENPLNDFESAVENLAKMHVTYLNQYYDLNVLNKWAASTVAEEGCFQGMDGLSYMERHLGYRLLIAESILDYEFWADELSVEIVMQNVGFAPLYKEPEKLLVIYCMETGKKLVYPVEAELRTLAGGTESEQLLAITEKVDIKEFPAGEYEVYFSIRDTDSGCYIELANEQEMKRLGYKLGEFRVEAMPDLTEARWKYFMPGNSIEAEIDAER